jgi:dipeptidyl aminopeptidase/acylaminoacyl peptidase
LQPQDGAAGVADDPGGDVPQPVAQRLGLGAGQLAVQQQGLRPADEVLGGQDQLEPDLVAPPPVERQVGQAGGLGVVDAVLDAGALPVAQLQRPGPGWSPDSSQLAFRSLRDGNYDLYAIRPDGTGERRLTTGPARDYAPDWSPDGARIAFTSETVGGDSAVWSVRAVDGSDPRQLTPGSLNAGIPRYSPDGSRIAFVDQRCGGCTVQSDVWVVHTDGSGLRRVTSTPENETTEAWSQDGKRVAVDTARLVDHTLGKSDVAVLTMATAAIVDLANTSSASEAHADWRR